MMLVGITCISSASVSKTKVRSCSVILLGLLLNNLVVSPSLTKLVPALAGMGSPSLFTVKTPFKGVWGCTEYFPVKSEMGCIWGQMPFVNSYIHIYAIRTDAKDQLVNMMIL